MQKGDTISYFRLVEQIGEGGFGDVWKVISTEDDEAYAMKLEPTNSKRQTVQFEANILKRLQASDRFPKMLIEGTENDYHYLVEELLGPNLSMIARGLPGHVFISPFLAKLADEMLYCIEDFHKMGFIHRDIKPQNFVVRLKGETPLCLIDYGISRRYLDQTTGKHLDAREHTATMGSPIFASPNTHNREELSRRDDLYSLIYSVLILSQFSLPWVQESNPMEIGKMKQDNPISELCTPLGHGFVEVAEHIETLGFADTPDYESMHQSLSKQMATTSVPFEWMDIYPLKDGNKAQQTPDQDNNFDPSGFLMSLAPFLAPESEQKECNLI